MYQHIEVLIDIYSDDYGSLGYADASWECSCLYSYVGHIVEL